MVEVRSRIAESSGGAWWSVMTLMRLVSTALARLTPKVSSGMVTSSRQGLKEEEPKRTEQGDLAEPKVVTKDFWDDGEKKMI
jgi:hypothetical protein